MNKTDIRMKLQTIVDGKGDLPKVVSPDVNYESVIGRGRLSIDFETLTSK